MVDARDNKRVTSFIIHKCSKHKRHIRVRARVMVRPRIRSRVRVRLITLNYGTF